MGAKWYCCVLLVVGELLTMAMGNELAQGWSGGSLFTRHDAKMVDQVIAYLLMLAALLVTYLIH